MKKQRKLNSGAKMGFLFALPAAIYMMVFIGYPMIQNLILSFKNVDVYSFAQSDYRTTSSYLPVATLF